MTVIVDSVLVEFSKKEFDLLYFLANNQGNAFTRKQIIEAVWEHKHFVDRVVDTAVTKVRKKINDIKVETSTWSVNFTFLQTVPYTGYRLSEKLIVKIDDNFVRKNLNPVNNNEIVINGSYRDSKKNTVVVANVAESKFGRLIIFISGGNCVAMTLNDFKSIYKSL